MELPPGKSAQGEIGSPGVKVDATARAAIDASRNVSIANEQQSRRWVLPQGRMRSFQTIGRMAEWFKAAVLKFGDGHSIGPIASLTVLKKQRKCVP
jgi:hypothetical protein